MKCQAYFLGKIYICMKCHILFSEKNKKNISKCRLLKILPRVLSVKGKSWQRLCPLLQPNPSSCVRVMKHYNDFCLPSFGAWAGQSKATKEW